jgi:hypothetical protein
MPSRQLPTVADGHPKPQAQHNHRSAEGFADTDPGSHILKGSGGWIQGYDAQAAVDGDHQVIVAIGVSNQPSDAVHLLPMLERIQANTGRLPDAMNADAGYCSAANLEAYEETELNAYISTNRQQHGLRPRPSRGRAPRDLDARVRMDRKLRSKAGQEIYALRKTIVEPVFGQIKGARGPGSLPIAGSGEGEWGMGADGHHLQPAQVLQGNACPGLRARLISPEV